MISIQQIRLFISCPGDIKEELNSIKIIVEEINKTSGRQNAYYIECLNWITDTYTQIGEDSQQVINNQLDSKYDILIGLIWQRIGTPTKRDKSGTIEEINRALDNPDKELLIYFKTTSPETLNHLDLNQLKKVNLFKQKLSAKGVLYKEFNTIENFESLFRINIINLISDKILIPKSLKLENQSVNDRYPTITTLINEIEQKTDNQSIELDIFELIEGLLSSLSITTNSLGSMTSSLTDLTEHMMNRSKELNIFNSIKDNKLRMDKTQIIVNLLAGELNEFNSKINLELPRFSEYFLQIGPTYSKIMQYAALYEASEVNNMKTSVLDYRNSVEQATHQSAALIRIILSWPPTTSKLNKSKRETEVVLKNITKELLEGLKLLDEALQL